MMSRHRWFTAGVAVPVEEREQEGHLTSELGLAAQEDALPRHEYVVEDGQ